MIAGRARHVGPSLFVFDTNLWIDAARDRAASRDLQQFRRAHRERTYMLATVAEELIAGSLTAARRAEVDTTLGEFEARERTLDVSYTAECQAGRVLAALAVEERYDVGSLTASFLNDVRIAAACREHGAVLITRNVGDFVAIQRHLAGFRFLQPWP